MFSCKKENKQKPIDGKHAVRFPFWRERVEWRQFLVVIGCKSIKLWNIWFQYYGQPGLCWLVGESRLLYVRAKGSVLIVPSVFFIKEAIHRLQPLCSQRSTPTHLLMLSANLKPWKDFWWQQAGTYGGTFPTYLYISPHCFLYIYSIKLREKVNILSKKTYWLVLLWYL